MLSTLSRDEHPIAQTLSNFLNTQEGEFEVMLVGNNPVGVNSNLR
jgi:hypothetical protein